MFRNFLSLTTRVLTSGSRLTLQNVTKPTPTYSFVNGTRSLSSLLTQNAPSTKLFSNPLQVKTVNQDVRTVTKFSIRKGKRKSVKVVLKKFYRLHWGIWIRTFAGRQKRLWKKSARRRLRLKRHVFCNATQSRMLDKMVGPYWQKPRYYIDDPYEPYHTRDEWKFASTKPRPYIPPEER